MASHFYFIFNRAGDYNDNETLLIVLAKEMIIANQLRWDKVFDMIKMFPFVNPIYLSNTRGLDQ